MFPFFAAGGGSNGRIWNALKSSGRSDGNSVINAVQNLDVLYYEAGGMEPVAEYCMKTIVLDDRRCSAEKKELLAALIGIAIETNLHFGIVMNNLDSNFILKLTNPIPKLSEVVLVIGGICRNVPGTAQLLVSRDPQIGRKFKDLFREGDLDCRGSAVRTFGSIFAAVPQFGVQLCETDKDFAPLLSQIFYVTPITSVSRVALGLAWMCDNAPRFTEQFMQVADQKKVMTRICQMLRIHNEDNEEPGDALSLVEAISKRFEHFTALLIQSEPKLAEHISWVLSHKKDSTSYKAPVAISKILRRQPEFVQKLLKPELKISRKLGVMMSHSHEFIRAYAITAMANIVQACPEAARSLMSGDHKIPAKLLTMLRHPERVVQDCALEAIARFSNGSDTFSRDILKIDCNLHHKLLAIFRNNVPDQTAMLLGEAIVGMCHRQPNFATALVKADPQIGINFCKLGIKNSENKARVVGCAELLVTLSSSHSNFASELIEKHLDSLQMLMEILSKYQVPEIATKFKECFKMTDETVTFASAWHKVQQSRPDDHVYLENLLKTLQIPSVRNEVEAAASSNASPYMQFFITVMQDSSGDSTQARRTAAANIIAELIKILIPNTTRPLSLSCAFALLQYLK